MHDLIPLSRLNVGQLASVDQVFGDTDAVHRLHELGLRGGIEVEMLRPGSPCIIRLGEQRLCFRSDDVTGVLVRIRSCA